MGFGGISIWQLLIILAIVVLLFGTKRLTSLGSDLGSAIKGFKKSISDDEDKDDTDESGDAKRVEKEDEQDGAKSKGRAKAKAKAKAEQK